MYEEVKPAKPTLKSTNTRIDEIELRINDEVIATQDYCKESIHSYNEMLSLLVRKKSDELYTMLLGIFSCLAAIEFLQLFSAVGNMFMSTADCIFIGAKLFVYCWACWSCYVQGHLGEKKNYD